MATYRITIFRQKWCFLLVLAIYIEKPLIMTNEEIVEEIYHEAYSHGFIDELRKKVDEFRVCPNHNKLPHSELVYKAYYSIKPDITIQEL